MNTFLKIGLGFILGVVFTFGVLYFIGTTQNTEENQLREEIRIQALKNLKQSLDGANSDENGNNVQYFELTTKKGIVKLHTHMSKDSVKILMGRPESIDVNDYGYNGKVAERWMYRGTNRYVDEFTIEFIDGKLKSVDQFKDY